MDQIWKDMLTEHDKKCLANQSSFQPRRGLGSKPALIVIDMQKAVIGDDMPIYEPPITRTAISSRSSRL